MMQELHHDHLELDENSNLRRRQPMDRSPYPGQSPQRHHPRLKRRSSEVSINAKYAKGEPEDTMSARRRRRHNHDNTGTMPNESSSRVKNFQRKDLPQDSVKNKIEVRLSPTSTEVSPLSHQDDEHQSFRRSSTVKSADSTKTFPGGRKCILSPPSNLPFEPRVIQPYESLKVMEDAFFRQDKLNIFPSDPLADSSMEGKLVDTLRQITSSGVVLITSSLRQLLHIPFCEDQPRNILFEMFGAIPEFPPFVVTVTDTKTQDQKVNVYTTHLNQQVIHTVRMFTDEKISSIYGTIVPEDFQTREAFRAALSSIRAISGIFCNPKLLSMDIKRSHNVSRSCLLAMAVSGNIPATIKDVEVTLGSKKNLLDHWETMTSKLISRPFKTAPEKDVKTTLSRTSFCYGSAAKRDEKQTIAVYPKQRKIPMSPKYSAKPESEDSPNVHSRRKTRYSVKTHLVIGKTTNRQKIHPAASSTQSKRRNGFSEGQKRVVSSIGRYFAKRNMRN